MCIYIYIYTYIYILYTEHEPETPKPRRFELVVLPDVRAVPTARAIDLSRNKLEALSEIEFWDFHGVGKVCVCVCVWVGVCVRER